MAIPVDMLRQAARDVAAGESSAMAAPLLSLLGWDRAAPPAVAADRVLLLLAAADCMRVFQLAAPDAPGLWCFGAEVDLAAAAGEPGLPPIGSSGVAPDPGQAFAACIAEAVEFRAQVQTAAERAAEADDPDHLTLLRWPDGLGHRIARDRCQRRAPQRRRHTPAAPLSIGCTAGRTEAEARLRAVLELVERDAAALWWRGGHAGRPLALEAAAPAAGLLARLRGGTGRRLSWLLDITSDLGVPCVAAISLDGDGGFCAGTAARCTAEEAACAAVTELCQNELAHAVVLRKRAEAGDAALNARDRALLHRHGTVRAEPGWLIHPVGAPMAAAIEGEDADARLAALGRRLGAAGLDLLFFDHSPNADGMPVWRAICDGLACEPSTEASPRLTRAIAEFGGGPGLTAGVPLYS